MIFNLRFILISFFCFNIDEYQGEPEKISVKKCKAAQKMVDGPVVCDTSRLNLYILF